MQQAVLWVVVNVSVIDVKTKLIRVSGLNGEPIIFLSFLWYICNVYIHVSHGLSFENNTKDFSGFDSIEGFMFSAVVFTFMPHLLCMEKGKHNFLGIKFINDAIIIFPVFLLHYVLSVVIL